MGGNILHHNAVDGLSRFIYVVESKQVGEEIIWFWFSAWRTE